MGLFGRSNTTKESQQSNAAPAPTTGTTQTTTPAPLVQSDATRTPASLALEQEQPTTTDVSPIAPLVELPTTPVIEYEPPSRSWLSWRWRGPSLPNPGKFDELNRESKDNIDSTLNSVVDGLTVNATKFFDDIVPTAPPPSSQFNVSHEISLGSSDPAYSFTTIFAKRNGAYVGRWSSEGTVFARLIDQREKWGYSAQAQSTLSDPVQLGAELDYKGNSFYSQLKFTTPKILGVSYVQSLTSKLALGVEGYYNFQQSLSMTTGGFRYVEEHKLTKGGAPSSSKVWTGSQLNGMNFNFTYTQRFSQKVSVTSNYNLGMTQEGTMEAQWGLGTTAEVGNQPNRLTTARVHIGSDKKIIGVLENTIEPAFKFAISSVLDHDKKRLRLGISFTSTNQGA